MGNHVTKRGLSKNKTQNKMTKQRKILGWIITILASIAPAWGVIGKFSNAEMQSHMASIGYENWIQIIAIGELLAVVLFILPKTGRLGILLMSALMGGAIAAHMGHGESFTMQSTVLVLAWIAAFLRYPEFLKFNSSESE